MKLVNEPGEGRVTAILPKNRLRVEIDGFEYDYPLQELIIMGGEDASQATYGSDLGGVAGKHSAVTRVVIEDDEQPIEISTAAGVQHTNLGYREVDLHIQNLVPHWQKLSNGEMLNIQLNHFEKQLELALKHHEKRVVFIHGVGGGVLRNEIRQRLSARVDLEFNDASYHMYGYGATEVHLF